MVVGIQINGIKRVHKLMLNLSKNLKKETLNQGKIFMKNVLYTAKSNAPKDTGFLADQLNIKFKNDTIILDTGEAYYAYYQEYGFKPHLIPSVYFEQHIEAPNIPGRYTETVSFAYVSQNKPFLFPALLSNLPKLPKQLKTIVRNSAVK